MKGLIFTYLLTYGGAVAGLVWPYYGLLVYVCFAIIKPDALWHWSVPPGNYSRIVAMGLLVGWTLHGFSDWRIGRAFGIVLSLVLFMLWACLLMPLSKEVDLAWKYVELHLKIVLPFLVGITTIRTTQQLRQLAWVIVLSEGYLAYEFNGSYYGGSNSLARVGFAGSDNNTVAISLVTCIGMAFFLGFHAKRLWQKGVALCAALLMVNAVMFSFSRGGVLGLAITGGVAFWLIPKTTRHYLGLLLAVLVCLRLAGPEVLSRFGTSFEARKEIDDSATARLKHWKACRISILTKPWGLGPNQWRTEAPLYGLPRMEAHSYWLQTWAEEGWPGFFLFVSFYALCILRLWPLAREKIKTSDPWLTYLARMVIAALAGFIVSAQFVSVFGMEVPFYVVLVGAGAIKIASRDPVAIRNGFLGRSQPQSVPALFVPSPWGLSGRGTMG